MSETARTQPARVLAIVGTRPEAIKVAPVVVALRAAGGFDVDLLNTGQHPDMTTEALAAFGLAADVTLAIPPRAGGSQSELFAALLPLLEPAIARVDPAMVVLQGDTATALSAALAAFWQQIPVAHIEAGLRSDDLTQPFPEEAYRRLISTVTALHLAPTPLARANLLAENVDRTAVVCTGNTVVDASALVRARSSPPVLVTDRRSDRLVLITVHRRENWGSPLAGIIGAIAALADEFDDIEFVLPVHPNPIVQTPVRDGLGGHPNVRLLAPLGYPDLLHVLAAADLVLTDSGGIQEEAPGLGTPALVLRDKTERPEAIEAGAALLVGTDPDAILAESRKLLTDPEALAAMVRVGNPFGDGHAAQRCVDAIRWRLGVGPRPADWQPSVG
ncbi:MAG TPA: UDP-N-acetylglucosamine 2-epimerase (non-hydrolyzing) [Acidimicrobiales bacterium]|nr:UDP-N-acetylglucosamine 2-epimerase (non-hydrolyzing) [Acidimicrobiales bacterium]